MSAPLRGPPGTLCCLSATQLPCTPLPRCAAASSSHPHILLRTRTRCAPVQMTPTRLNCTTLTSAPVCAHAWAPPSVGHCSSSSPSSGLMGPALWLLFMLSYTYIIYHSKCRSSHTLKKIISFANPHHIRTPFNYNYHQIRTNPQWQTALNIDPDLTIPSIHAWKFTFAKDSTQTGTGQARELPNTLSAALKIFILFLVRNEPHPSKTLFLRRDISLLRYIFVYMCRPSWIIWSIIGQSVGQSTRQRDFHRSLGPSVSQ